MGNYVNMSNLQLQDLVSYAPIAVAMFVDAGFQSYSSGIYTGCPSFNSSVAGLNHAVLLIGYDSSGNYIIKNSWGTGWEKTDMQPSARMRTALFPTLLDKLEARTNN